MGVSGGDGGDEQGKQGWAGILTVTVGGLDARVSYSAASFFYYCVSYLNLFSIIKCDS